MTNNLYVQKICCFLDWQIFLYLVLFFLQLSGDSSNQGISSFCSSDRIEDVSGMFSNIKCIKNVI